MLEAELRAVLPDLQEIRDLHRLTGGASRETWAFESGDRALIYRRGAGVGREAVAIRAAALAGVPEPEVIAFGEDWAVMERVPGETIARRILRTRPRLGRQCGEILARIHSIELDGLSSSDALTDLRSMIGGFSDLSPALELGLDFLVRNRPPAARECVLHGDFRLGNLVVSEHGIAAVLDWELVHRGDPMQDLGYLCVRAWRFGGELPVGGFGEYEELFDAYERASGFDVDRDAVRWWELFGTVWWGAACMLQAWRHLSGSERSVELAAIGRRVWEQEYDVLLALA